MSELDLLQGLGRKLESHCGGEELRTLLVRALLKVRDKQGRLVLLEPNAAQVDFSKRCTRRNIVLKARQLGITTWAAARFFINTITRPGMVTVQVAHDQDSAEEIFRIVHRFQENLPEVAAGLRVKTIATQAGELPLIPDWSLPYTGTPGSGSAQLPCYIVSEDLIEYHWLTDANPRVFQLGVTGSLAKQMVVVKFGAVVVKGAGYAHAKVVVDR